MQMLEQGDRPLVEIQEYIDARYASQQRARTPTPLPPQGYVAPAYRPRP
jgi:hypothetical protein